MIGRTVSHYTIVEEVGRGGMGVVYKAQDTTLDRMVALKFLPVEFSGSSDERQRFLQEAKAASALDHANICTVYEVGETDDGRMFIAMAYYEGETLKETIRNGPLPVQDAVRLGVQLSRALARLTSARLSIVTSSPPISWSPTTERRRSSTSGWQNSVGRPC